VRRPIFLLVLFLAAGAVLPIAAQQRWQGADPLVDIARGSWLRVAKVCWEMQIGFVRALRARLKAG
jgi:hypothetical protein